MSDDPTTYADEHENGQLRLACAGEQVPLFALPDSAIPTDVDAVERLEEKLATLEAKREAMKARNAAYRKEHRAELKTMGAYERSQAVPHASYELQNLGGNIGRVRERLEQLKRAAVIVAEGGRGYGRAMVSRFASDCAGCGERIEKGETITYYKLTREAVHGACDTKGA